MWWAILIAVAAIGIGVMLGMKQDSKGEVTMKKKMHFTIMGSRQLSLRSGNGQRCFPPLRLQSRRQLLVPGLCPEHARL